MSIIKQFLPGFKELRSSARYDALVKKNFLLCKNSALATLHFSVINSTLTKKNESCHRGPTEVKLKEIINLFGNVMYGIVMTCSK